LALVWLPLERSCARLAAEIPRLSASIATMQRQASEVARVRSMPAIAASAAAPTVTIAEALGKALPGAQTAAIDAKRVRLTGTDVAYGALLEALASGQAAYGLHVDTARIEALPAAGRVRVELVLARP
jgi:general secretion pathway protein M